MNHPTPATVIAGFLGSGKTTIIGHLIDELQLSGEQVVYIKNEIGDADLDAKIMAGKNIQSKELLNGCICCTLVGPFYSAVDEIIEQFHPDRIIIEASGAADPSALAMMITSHPKLSRDGVIGVIDVVNFEGYKDISPIAQNQAKFTDLLVFNKIELASLEQKQAVVGYVRELNESAPIVEAPNGKIASELVFGITTKTMTKMPKTNHAHHDIQGISTELPADISQPKLDSMLKSLPSVVFRAKGVLMADNETWIFNKVGSRIDWQKVAENFEIKRSFIILIGHHIDHDRAELLKIFDAR